jgi:hypothetical protein
MWMNENGKNEFHTLRCRLPASFLTLCVFESSKIDVELVMTFLKNVMQYARKKQSVVYTLVVENVVPSALSVDIVHLYFMPNCYIVHIHKHQSATTGEESC